MQILLRLKIQWLFRSPDLVMPPLLTRPRALSSSSAGPVCLPLNCLRVEDPCLQVPLNPFKL